MPDNGRVVTETMMPVNGIQVCLETFGERTDPPLLLLAGEASSMDWWDDEFCRRLAAGGRYVIRYDHRDTGRSTSYPVGSPPYSQVDLAHDALGVLDRVFIDPAGEPALTCETSGPPGTRTLNLRIKSPQLCH